MEQWKIAILSPGQIGYLRELGDFIDRANIHPDDETLNPPLYGEAGIWKEFRVISRDKAQIDPDPATIARIQEQERILRLIQNQVHRADIWAETHSSGPNRVTAERIRAILASVCELILAPDQF